MIKINLQNVEKLLLLNPEARNVLQDLRFIFDNWLLGYRFPLLNNLRQQAKIDLLNYIDNNHLEKLAKIFNDIVFVDILNYNVVENLNFPIESSTEEELSKYSSFGNFSVYRDDKQVYLTMWR